MQSFSLRSIFIFRRGAPTGASVVSREELYELVWSAPMIKVAEKFKVSGSYMARICTFAPA